MEEQDSSGFDIVKAVQYGALERKVIGSHYRSFRGLHIPRSLFHGNSLYEIGQDFLDIRHYEENISYMNNMLS